jgi:hypothetical protein
MRKLVLPLLIVVCLAVGSSARAACTNPSGQEADKFYNQDYHTWQFCNGTSWIAYGPGGCFTPQTGAYQPTIPSGSGFFVLTSATYNGNLGGSLAAADALCLTELTTHTGWRGYATANSNGQLIAAKVHALLCTSATCNNLMPLTTYTFASAMDATAGGASFTTDSGGLGPNDQANWAAANYFSGTYSYWTNLGVGPCCSNNNAWTGGSGGSNACTAIWNSSGSGNGGKFGSSAQTGNGRWSATNTTCDTGLHLICFVNP